MACTQHVKIQLLGVALTLVLPLYLGCVCDITFCMVWFRRKPSWGLGNGFLHGVTQTLLTPLTFGIIEDAQPYFFALCRLILPHKLGATGQHSFYATRLWFHSMISFTIAVIHTRSTLV